MSKTMTVNAKGVAKTFVSSLPVERVRELLALRASTGHEFAAKLNGDWNAKKGLSPLQFCWAHIIANEVACQFEAIHDLSCICDGAKCDDAQGFNKVDSAKGRALAKKPLTEWTQDDFQFARRCAKKYHGQLDDTTATWAKGDIPTVTG